MSHLARTPESYAAWERVKRGAQLRPHELPWLPLEKKSQELDLLVADMQKSPSLKKLKAFFKRSIEINEMTEQSLARSLQSMRDQELCQADIRAAEEANGRGVEAENQRVEYTDHDSFVVAEMRALLEEMQQQEAENERLVVALGILTRRDSVGDLVCCCDKCGTQT